MVASTKEVVSSTVNGAKDAVANGVSGVVDMTRSVVSGSVNTVMGSRVGQMVANGVDAVLDMSEDLVDHYLPVTEQELSGSHVTPRALPFLGSSLTPSFVIQVKLVHLGGWLWRT